MATHVLLIEADSIARQELTLALQSNGYLVYGAVSGAEALHFLTTQPIDIVVAEPHLPDILAPESFIATIKKNKPTVLLFIQTSQARVESVIAALNARALAYFLKPYPYETLLGLIAQEVGEREKHYRQQLLLDTIMSEAAQFQERCKTPLTMVREAIHIGHLQIDRYRHQVSFQDQLVPTTATQYKLLCCLAERPGHTISGAEIVLRTHGLQIRNEEALLLLKAHIRNLRRKIPPSYLVNIRGFGYQLTAPHNTYSQFRQK
jgi:two-component system response regulator ChvI